MITSVKIKKEWKERDGWYQNPDTGLWVRLGNNVRLGDDVRLDNNVRLGNYVRLGDNVRLGDDVRLGDGVSLISITHKYTGALVVNKNDVQIRIGCEAHPSAQWDSHGEKLAAKHNESGWWEATGKYMLELLKVEAQNIEKELKKEGERNG